MIYYQNTEPQEGCTNAVMFHPVYEKEEVPEQLVQQQSYPLYTYNYLPPANYISKETILDEILVSLYQTLPPDKYEEYKETIMECIFENEQRNIIINQDGSYYSDDNNAKMVEMFLASKSIEGCSSKTISKYRYDINRCLNYIHKDYSEVTTNDIRCYIAYIKTAFNLKNITCNNIRATLNSFYNWLEQEDYIFKSPMRKIRSIKMEKVIREIITEENMEMLRIACDNLRDIAIIDTLASTGVRLSELSGMDITDINFNTHSCIVLGKGNKEREVYLNAKSRVNIKRYIDSRVDDNPALWVSLETPYNRLSNRSIQEILTKIQSNANLPQRIHPHMFRRTAATMALQRGMTLEEVQIMLGHESTDTTLKYAQVNRTSIKSSHEKYMN